MQVTQEQTKPCEVDLRIEIEADVFKSAIDDAYKQLAKTVKVDGFRPGKTPRVVLEKVVGDEAAIERALDKLIQPAYSEALTETKVEPWAQAEIDLEECEIGKPLVFVAKVPLAPKVELGQYVGLEVERNVGAITNDDVDAEILKMRQRQMKFEQITDRPAQLEDTAVLELFDEEEPDAEPKKDVAVIGEALPEFNEALTGMNVGDEKPVAVTYPEDYPKEDLKGKEKSMRVKLVELHKGTLPELTDEWVAEYFAPPADLPEPPAADEIVDTVEKLQAKVRSVLEEQAIESADTQVQDQILDKVIAGSTIDYPDVMVKENVDERLNQLMKRLSDQGITLEAYLQYQNKTVEQLREQYAETADKALKLNLAIYEVVEKENIKVEEADVESEIAKIAEANHLPIESAKAYIDSTGRQKDIQYQLLHKKALDFLVGASNIKNVG